MITKLFISFILGCAVGSVVTGYILLIYSDRRDR